jgi:glycerophosphoryl diester phosphodiesterase
MFGPVFVAAARRSGLPVQAWIIDEAEDIRRLIDWGVTGIISDRPDTAVEVIRATLHSPGG